VRLDRLRAPLGRARLERLLVEDDVGLDLLALHVRVQLLPHRRKRLPRGVDLEEVDTRLDAARLCARLLLRLALLLLALLLRVAARLLLGEERVVEAAREVDDADAPL